jgi:hypothetical protein
MIAFDHGALQHHREPLLARILAHGVLEVSDAQVGSFVDRLSVEALAKALKCAALMIAILLVSPAIQAQSDVRVDSFDVSGSIVTITALKIGYVRIRAGSAGKAAVLVARAIDVDAWILGARKALAGGLATDALEEPPPNAGQRARLQFRPTTSTLATLEILGRDGTRSSVVLGSILVTRFLEALDRGANRAHSLLAGIGQDFVPGQMIDPPCTQSMARMRQSRGSPERVTKYDEGAYHSVEWSYNNGAFASTFRWQDGEPDCRLSTFDSHE